jgi:hypothetical protein
LEVRQAFTKVESPTLETVRALAKIERTFGIWYQCGTGAVTEELMDASAISKSGEGLLCRVEHNSIRASR